MAFIATNTQLERYFRKAALGQASIIANGQADIKLNYYKFDGDTGERIDDEVLMVDYGSIKIEHDNLTSSIALQQARLDTLAVVLAYLDTLLLANQQGETSSLQVSFVLPAVTAFNAV